MDEEVQELADTADIIADETLVPYDQTSELILERLHAAGYYPTQAYETDQILFVPQPHTDRFEFMRAFFEAASEIQAEAVIQYNFTTLKKADGAFEYSSYYTVKPGLREWQQRQRKAAAVRALEPKPWLTTYSVLACSVFMITIVAWFIAFVYNPTL